MSTTTANHELAPLKTQVSSDRAIFQQNGEWMEQGDFMVFFVSHEPRAFMPTEDYLRMQEWSRRLRG
jgi:hypothetical protein